MKIIVLNADYNPIHYASFKKGYNLVYKGKAEILISDDSEDILVLTKKKKRPKVIRLHKYVNLPYRRMNLSKHNIFKRDGFICQYCGSDDKLTLDHVYPKSRGGKNTWKNLVAACSRCNNKKDDKTPKEAGMKLRRRPFIPTLTDLLGFDKEELMRVIMSDSL